MCVVISVVISASCSTIFEAQDCARSVPRLPTPQLPALISLRGYATKPDNKLFVPNDTCNVVLHGSNKKVSTEYKSSNLLQPRVAKPSWVSNFLGWLYGSKVLEDGCVLNPRWSSWIWRSAVMGIVTERSPARFRLGGVKRHSFLWSVFQLLESAFRLTLVLVL
jgi:hypothetical protein